MDAHRIRNKKWKEQISGLHTVGSEIPFPNWPQTHACVSNDTLANGSEHMVDTVGFKRNPFNPCFHEKFKKVPDLDKYTCEDSNFKKYFHVYTNGCRLDFLDLDAALSVGIPGDFESWCEDFAARAEKHFVTAVEPTVDLFNFIRELIDPIKKAFELLELGISGLQEKFVKAITQYKRFLKRHPGKYWLAWNFAIAPFIEDVKAICSSFNDANKRLKWLRKFNHRDVKVKYREPEHTQSGTTKFVTTARRPGNAQAPNGPDVWDVDFHIAWESEITLCAQAYVRFDIPDLFLGESEYFSASQRVWWTMMGFDRPLSIIWEATPFSWMIDWCRSARNRLDIENSLDLSLFKDATLLSQSHSIKYTLKARVYYSSPCRRNAIQYLSDEDGLKSTTGVYYAGELEYELYNRAPGPLTTEDHPLRWPFNWYNASIIASLIKLKPRR